MQQLPLQTRFISAQQTGGQERKSPEGIPLGRGKK
jgi:hypothetical protein